MGFAQTPVAGRQACKTVIILSCTVFVWSCVFCLDRGSGSCADSGNPGLSYHHSVFLCSTLDKIKCNLRKEQRTVMELNFVTMHRILSPLQVCPGSCGQSLSSLCCSVTFCLHVPTTRLSSDNIYSMQSGVSVLCLACIVHQLTFALHLTLKRISHCAPVASQHGKLLLCCAVCIVLCGGFPNPL